MKFLEIFYVFFYNIRVNSILFPQSKSKQITVVEKGQRSTWMQGQYQNSTSDQNFEMLTIFNILICKIILCWFYNRLKNIIPSSYSLKKVFIRLEKKPNATLVVVWNPRYGAVSCLHKVSMVSVQVHGVLVVVMASQPFV